MLAQVNINQNIHNNVLYSNSTARLLNSAMIKNGQGKQVFISWDNEKQQTNLLKGDILEGDTLVEDTPVEDAAVGDKPVAEDTSYQKNIKTYYGISTVEAYNMQLGIGAKIEKGGSWVAASGSQIQEFFVPSEANIEKYKFQFLNLASPAGISEEDAKAYLCDKGILSGKEAVFIEAAKANNVNEIYLMAHACLETGNGTSKLATGVVVNGKTVYNMFGIGAVDSDPIGKGSMYAYNMGWTTPEKAILGGAQFISKNYINNYPYNQDTLYEMRWNPASPGRHQYATDIAWAAKQAEWIEKIYKCFTNPIVTFDIPVYRK